MTAVATFGQNFRSFLLDQSAIAAVVGTHVHVGSVPQDIEPPYIYVQRARANHERTLDQAQGEVPFEEQWDLEAIADTPDDLESLVEAVRGIDCARGDFGEGTMQSLFLQDQEDSYLPKGLYSDEGLDVAAWSVTIYGYVPGEIPN